MVTVLVTGAAGFIGSHTCERLVASGHRVVGLDNFRTGRKENLRALAGHRSFELLTVDVAELRELDHVVAATKPDAIIHLAALVSVPESIADPAANLRLNVHAPALVAEAARRHHVRRLVFASSAAVYGGATELPLREELECHPLSPYGEAKLATEALLLAPAHPAGFTAVCLRYFNVFGPRQDPRSPYSGVISIFTEKIKQGVAPVIFGDGEQTRDFISVHDVARANELALTLPASESCVANLCTGKPTSLNQLAAILRRLCPGAPHPAYQPVRAGDIRHSVGATGRASQQLGFDAEKSLEAGLAELIKNSPAPAA